MESFKQDYTNICALIGQLTHQKHLIEVEVDKLTAALDALGIKIQESQKIQETPSESTAD